jgi:hypothetical protein
MLLEEDLFWGLAELRDLDFECPTLDWVVQDCRFNFVLVSARMKNIVVFE